MSFDFGFRFGVGLGLNLCVYVCTGMCVWRVDHSDIYVSFMVKVWGWCELCVCVCVCCIQDEIVI